METSNTAAATPILDLSSGRVGRLAAIQLHAKIVPAATQAKCWQCAWRYMAKLVIYTTKMW